MTKTKHYRKRKATHKRKAKNTSISVIKTTHHMPMAQKTRVCFEMAINGYFAAGSANSVAYLGLNFCSQNSSTGSQGPVACATAQLPNLISLSTNNYPNGYVIYMDPTGGNAGSFYEQCVVYACRITLTIAPQAVADLCEISLIPVKGQNSVAGVGFTVATAYPNVRVASGGPYGKSLLVTSNNNIKQNTLTSYLDVAKFFGVTKKVLYTDENYIQSRILDGEEEDSNILQAPYNLAAWQINYQSCDNANLTEPLIYKINVKYYCLLQQPATMGLSV